MTFNQLFLQFQKKYGNDQNTIFFEILFSLSKITKTKELFITFSNKEIDFKEKNFWKKSENYFVKQMPLAHVVGTTTFLGLRFQVSKKVLAPRDITEQMTKDFIDAHKHEPYLKILDLCCGCGCIGISIKKHCPQHDVICVDKYWAPIFDTNANAIYNHTKLTIDVKDAFKYLDHLGRIDILISNPPYINKDNFDNYKMFKWENKKALIAPDNGLAFYKKYFEWLSKHTFKEAWLEFGYDQVEALKNEFTKYPNLSFEIKPEKQYLIVRNK